MTRQRTNPVLFRGVALLAAFTAGCASTHASARDTRAAEGFVDAAGGVRLYYRVAGTGSDTIVVLHGGPGLSSSYLAPDLEPLAARHTIIFYDQRGTGRSTVLTDSSSLAGQRFAEDLEAMRVRFGLARMSLFAHSWGAGVAALYATRHPERIGRLLIVDPISVRRMYHARGFQTLDTRRDTTTQRRLRDLNAARLANTGDAGACRDYYALFYRATFFDGSALRRSRGDFCAGTPEALTNKIKGVDRFTIASLGDWDWRSALRAVAAPALAIRGVADHVPLESAREWATALPNARFLSLDRAGHFPYLEVPDRFFAAVGQFLAGGWPSAAETVSTPGRY